jgi:chitinase
MRRFCLLVGLITFCWGVKAQQKTFRVIGYLRTQNIRDGSASQVDYSKVTHINIAFVNPDSTGNFEEMPGLKAFADKMHARHVKVLASIGGGLSPAYYADLLNDTRRPVLIQKLAQLTESYDLDGIDVDLEGERIDTNYEKFITGLSTLLKQKNKLMTAAVATVYKDRYTDKALACFDFISIMSYDKTGPWRPENPGQHAPYEMAVADMNYWAVEKGMAKEKLNLGIPFYGYGFGPGAPQDMSFKKIVSYSGAENKDEVALPGGGVIYYNGIPTIKNKTTLALQQAGGIMIWQLLQDATGANSLLGTVDNVIKSAK